MKEDNLLLATIEDKLEQCEKRYMETNTAFLDMRQRSLAQAFLRKMPVGVRYVFWGGYEEAERTSLIFLPEYSEDEDKYNCMALIRVETDSKAGSLNHRDYLGSLMAQGVRREMIGDILVREHGADIIVMEEIADYIKMNYSKAGNTYLTVEIADFSDIRMPKQDKLIKTCTVASLRLDNMISAAFNVQRSAGANSIKAGMAFVNNMETLKPDLQLKEGDVFVLRGKGKARVLGIGGKSRKDRIYVEIEIYL